MKMPDTLLAATAVKLFGRPAAGLHLDLEVIKSEKIGAFLKNPLAAAEPLLALIYGYSHQGQYYALAQPALFLVHGQGSPAGSSGTTSTGVAAKDFTFESDIVFWDYDRADFSLRLDIDSGPLERILLEAEQQDGEMPYFRGAHTRFRGAHTRLRGSGE
jgi:hypothetical protein